MILSNSECQEYKEIIDLMLKEKMLSKMCYDNKVSYMLVGDLQVFKSKIDNEDKKAHKLSIREWIIAIVSAIIGALLGMLPTFW